tara:strand:- start:4152 stop:4472 length:321 start_codon:yes stop_codon:yes gene_type:complete
MAAQKIMDITVKTGEYQDPQSGMTKGRYQNVGSLMLGDDGRQFIILERWFNPAGIPNPQNRPSVILSLFEPNGQQAAPAPQQPPQQGYGQQAPQQGYPNAHGGYRG